MRLSDLYKSCLPCFSFLALLLCACQATQMQKDATENNLMENFHRGISYEEVERRTGASDITDLVCYKGGYILKDSGKTKLTYLRIFNMLAEGYGKTLDTFSLTIQFDLGAFDSSATTIVTTSIGGRQFSQVFMEEFDDNLDKNVLYRVDTSLDRGYRDKIISPNEVKNTRKAIVKDSYEGKFPLKVDLPEID